MTHAADGWTGAWPKSGTLQHQTGCDLCHFQLRRNPVPPWHILRRYAWIPTSFRLSQNEMHTSGWQLAREAFYSKKQQQQAFWLLPLCPWSALGTTGTRLPGWSGWQQGRKAAQARTTKWPECRNGNCELQLEFNERTKTKQSCLAWFQGDEYVCVTWSMKFIWLTTVFLYLHLLDNNNDARPCFYLVKLILGLDLNPGSGLTQIIMLACLLTFFSITNHLCLCQSASGKQISNLPCVVLVVTYIRHCATQLQSFGL